MNKAELQSKHLSELHELAAAAGVERYRMLPRAELIDALAEGDGGDSGRGDDSNRSSERSSRGGRGGSRGGRGQGGGRDRQRGGRGRERRPREDREREPRGDRESRGDRAPRGRDESASTGGREEAPAPAPGERPKRRRRRRFGRRRGKTVRPHEMLIPAAGARQALVYAESREGCTSLLRELAADLSGGKGPDPVALLVDPSPEELADWKREAPKAEIVSAGQERHAEDALAQAVRRAESGEDVVFLIDSLTRVGEEFGGAKVAKDLFDGGLGSGAGAGTLTVIAAVERPAD